MRPRGKLWTDDRPDFRGRGDRGLRAARAHRPGGGTAVNAVNIAGLVLVVVTAGYLVAALLFPERF
ncbi:potassium-transporting ATPase subunit F [Frankia sp. CNm7]|nr:potassium-transporting ATPase subunit F [Frankia nepalensis]MBL7512524.1 potassium-transporting ATPase subunit F [Frankia nepalensis]MBL7517423.1 potassium-transporting ATPase subunit F [Frankia nepalensis]